MNNVLLGLEQSPLYQSILEGSSYQDFVYKLQDSLGAISKHRMEIPFSSVEANTNISFDLPEYGLVHRMYLRMTIRNSATDAGNSLVLDTGYFANLFSRISLISHSREIEQLTPLALLQYVLSQPATKKASLKKLVDYASNPIGGQITNSVKPSLSQAEFQAAFFLSSTPNFDATSAPPPPRRAMSATSPWCSLVTGGLFDPPAKC